jgi:hypothetical protein
VRSTILDDHVWLDDLATLREYGLIHLTRVHPECSGLLIDGIASLVLLLKLGGHPIVL